MGSEKLKSALQDVNEVELKVTGRKSGNETSRPIWFVLEGDKLLLLPVGGSESNWYRNIRKTPTIGLNADGADYHGEAEPTEDPSAVQHVLTHAGYTRRGWRNAGLRLTSWGTPVSRWPTATQSC